MAQFVRGDRVESIGTYRHGARGVVFNVAVEKVITKPLGIVKPLEIVEVLLDGLRDDVFLGKEPKTVIAMTRQFPASDLKKIGKGEIPVAPDAGEHTRKQRHWRDVLLGRG